MDKDEDSKIVNVKEWYEDEKLTEAEAKSYVDYITAESDKWLKQIWDGYGKWAMFALGITSFGLGAVGGYYKSLDRELRGKPLPPGAWSMGFRALAYATALTLGTTAVTIYGVAKALNVSSVREFNQRMSSTVPIYSQKAGKIVDSLGMKRSLPDDVEDISYEIESLEGSLEEVFRESNIFEEMQSEMGDSEES